MKVSAQQLSEIQARITENYGNEYIVTFEETREYLVITRTQIGTFGTESGYDERCRLPQYVAPLTEDSKLSEVRSRDKYEQDLQDYIRHIMSYME